MPSKGSSCPSSRQSTIRGFSLCRLFQKASISCAPPSPPEPRSPPAIDEYGPAPPALLASINSFSPASEIPSTWPEWERAYAAGLIDFNNPPPPPSCLSNSHSTTSSGQLRAPRPLNERRRQRAVDSLNPSRGRSQTRRSAGGAQPEDGGGPSEDPDYIHDVSTILTRDSSTSSSIASADSNELFGRPVFQKLAADARRIFRTGFAGMSLLDEGEYVFLGEEGLGVMPGTCLPRENSICSHTLLQGTTGQDTGLVVLDMSRDWRFVKSNYGAYDHGFYAAHPIKAPAPFGDDSADYYLVGVFCIVDQDPRSGFSREDRKVLRELARQAGAEIARWKEEQQKRRILELEEKREVWRGTDALVAAEVDSGFGDLPLTPPESTNVDAVGREGRILPERSPSSSSSARSTSEPPWRPVPESFAVTSSPPTFRQRGFAGERMHGVFPTSTNAPPNIQSFFDLATQLLAESLGLEFVYLVAVHLPSSSHPSPSPLRVLSAHNIPIPPPLFDVELHRATLENGAILYSDPDCEAEYTTGVLVKVSLDRNALYVLGAFSDDPRRVLDRLDLLFALSFATDLARHTSCLK